MRDKANQSESRNILISACLLGVNCTYSGVGKLLEGTDILMERYNLIPVCPEIFGGLSTPRAPAEIRDGRVWTKTGEEVTESYLKGAKEVLHLAKLYHCKYAILKDRSPSCGKDQIYDGTFNGKLIQGDGICVRFLEENGVTCIQESKANEFFLNL